MRLRSGRAPAVIPYGRKYWIGDGVSHAEGRLDPGADLLGVVERPRLDLLPESLDLGRPEATGIALVVQGAELIEPLVAEDAKPLPDLAGRDSHQLGDLLPG